MNIERNKEVIKITNDRYEVHIQKKIFKGYILKKYIKNSPFELLELRDIRIDIPEEKAISFGEELLNQIHNSTRNYSTLNFQPT